MSDHSPETLERAIKEAPATTVKGATVTGFSCIRLDSAGVLEDAVVVWMVASDDDTEDTPDEAGPSVSTPLSPASDGF